MGYVTEETQICGTIPTIEPIAGGVSRPLWSVMIPTYNCAKYLRETLQSVLVQDPGTAQMQIEVVDDCSTKDDPKQTVGEIAKGRVVFYRQSQNVGAVRNFNACIRRARGRLVHILHGDDAVDHGFYTEIEHLATKYPDTAFLATRSVEIDERGRRLRNSPQMPSLRTSSDNPADLLCNNPVRTPSVVIRRSFYEKHGGFVPQLPHVADWEMWFRAIVEGRGVMSDRPLARYRIFGDNDTSQLMRTAGNLRDWLRFGEIVSARLDSFDRNRFLAFVRVAGAYQLAKFAHGGDREAVCHNREFLDSLPRVAMPWSLRVAETILRTPLLGIALVRARQQYQRLFQ